MSNTLPPLPARPYRRIATEEAFAPPEMLEIDKRILSEQSQFPAVFEPAVHEVH